MFEDNRSPASSTTLPAVAATAPRGTRSAGQEALPHLRCVARDEMRDEPVEFFREMLVMNPAHGCFLDSNWTMANPRLCDFYGLPEPKADGFQRIRSSPRSSRRSAHDGRVARADFATERATARCTAASAQRSDSGQDAPAAAGQRDPHRANPPKSARQPCAIKSKRTASDANCAACHAKSPPRTRLG